MKKIFLGMILVLSAVTHWACGNSKSSPSSPAPPGPTYPFLYAFGNFGTGNGQFTQPWGVAVRQNEIYVTDYGNNRVQVFNLDGTYLKQFAASTPSGIAINKYGTVYVTNYISNQILEFDLNGNSLGTVGSAGTGLGNLSSPEAVAVDTNLNIYVTEQGNNRVQKCGPAFTAGSCVALGGTAAGTAVRQFNSPTGIALDASGNVYVSYAGNNRVQKCSGSLTNPISLSGGGTGDGQVTNPFGLTVDQDGNLLVADESGARIEKFTTSGSFLQKFGSSGPNPGQFYSPR